MGAERLAVADLGRVFQGETVSGLSEWQLLERYLERRDEIAFEALVARHAPMVLGVCRRVLGFTSDAEDAFQATFLVLVRRARDLSPRDAIGPWLYGVAVRVAARARSQAARRRSQAAPLENTLADRPGRGLDPDLLEVLDAELRRLPGKYRSPLVLCYLEGRTHEEAARELQWPVGTVKGRLARGREILRERLSRRGFAPAGGVLGLFASPEIIPAFDYPLLERIVGPAGRLMAGESLAQVVSRSVTSQVEGALSAMFLSKIRWAALAVIATGFVFTSAVVLGRQVSDPPKARVHAGQDHGKGVHDDDRPAPGGGGRMAGVQTKRYQPVDGQAEGRDAARDNNPRSLQIMKALEEPVSMSFANETPLGDVLKYIKQATTSPKFSGIPIYVDPVGLQDAERSLQSTIQIDLEGVPLRRTLQLVLTQLGLVYFVQDGVLVITAADEEEVSLPPSMVSPTPLDRMVEKAERGEMSAGEIKELIEVVKLSKQVSILHHLRPHAHGEGIGSGEDAGPNANPTQELLKEVRELIKLLKAEREGHKTSDKPGQKSQG
ncbi:MAG: RNA polymerase sigma factor [Isosphaeraceae bacterium]